MKLVCISDTHSLHNRINKMPKGDILCFAGDLTRNGYKEDVDSFHKWLSQLDYKYKIIIAGNHDWCFQTRREKAEAWLKGEDKSIIYLESSEVVIDGVKFYRDPHQPRFYDWAFNLDRGESLKKKWSLIPEDTDVLITHGAPAGILDPDYFGDSVGDVDLLDRIYEIRPKVHIFGHLHSGYGVLEKGSTTYINASICTNSYIPKNKPIVMEI